MKTLTAMGLYILGALGLGLTAASVRFTQNSDVWPGEIIAYGLGTTGFFIGALFTLIGFFVVLHAISDAFPGLLKVQGADEPEEQTTAQE